MDAASPPPLRAPSLREIRAAAGRLAGITLSSPLVPLQADGPARIFLKLENLQPIGSFKLRGAVNALARLDPSQLQGGVYTASAGNMAQGLAWAARRLGVPCSIVVPDHAPEVKLAAIARLGGRVVKRPFEQWWEVLVRHRCEELEGTFLHPVSDPDVIAGNGTVGLEILEDLPEVDTVVVPYGGGGLSTGIACALRELKPGARVFAAEVDTAAPLAPALAAGAPVEVGYRRTFVDGIGSTRVLDEMWPLVREALAGSIVVSPAQIADAIRLLVERCHVVAEGAGAASVAAALTGKAGTGNVVAVVSGGNIDPSVLAGILRGDYA